MTAEPAPSPIRRRRWPWAVAAGLALTYLIAGFGGIPWLAKRELPRLVEEKLHHSARIGSLSFNPFTLKLTARDFALENKEGGTMLGFSAATADLEWRSLARRAWIFSEVHLVNPSVQAVISRNGRLNLAELVPRGSASAGAPARVEIARFTLENGRLEFDDQRNGLDRLALEHITANLGSVTSHAPNPLAFEMSGNLQGGGRLALRGSAVPSAGTLDAKVEATGLSLAPLRPWVAARYDGLRLAAGDASFAGRLRVGGKESKLAYTGTASVANVKLNDADEAQLLGWKTLATESLRLTLSPDRLDVDEARWIEPAGRFAIATDGSSNLSRAFAKKNAPPAQPDAGETAAPAGEDAFAVAVRRVRVEQGALDFSDESLSQRYVAEIHELAGTANDLSSDRGTRSQFSFEGRVDQYGYARLAGAINVFSPRERTAFRVRLRNIDLASVSPYSMEFAGYRLASGHMAVDLNYRVRGRAIEGENRITLQKVTLGEHVDSPRAMRLPLQLAVALLKDRNGTINMDLPVRGNLDDPQFSFAAIIWKAIGNFVERIVTAPFRVLTRLAGSGSGDEEVGVIAFDPGRSRLLPPEQEKIARVVEVLAKRPDLKLVIPARYDAAADARALKRAALGRDIARRARYKVADAEDPGPVNIEDRSTRSALRALFGERFSTAELDKLKAEAEAKGTAAPSVVSRVRNFAAGDPQVADAREFYLILLRRLRENQALPANALEDLARSRAQRIDAALRTAGVDPARITQAAAEPTTNAEAQQVTVQLTLALAQER